MNHHGNHQQCTREDGWLVYPGCRSRHYSSTRHCYTITAAGCWGLHHYHGCPLWPPIRHRVLFVYHPPRQGKRHDAGKLILRIGKDMPKPFETRWVRGDSFPASEIHQRVRVTRGEGIWGNSHEFVGYCWLEFDGMISAQNSKWLLVIIDGIVGYYLLVVIGNLYFQHGILNDPNEPKFNQ